MTGDLAKQQAGIIGDEIEQSLQALGEIKVQTYKKVTTSKIFGKSLDEWNRELSIKVDPSADPAKVKWYASQLAEAIDISYANLSKSKQMYAKYKLSYFPHFNSVVHKQATHKGRKVAPAMDTMMRVAESELGDRALAIIEFEALIDFWLDMVFKLKSQVGLLSTISISNGTQYKIGEY